MSLEIFCDWCSCGIWKLHNTCLCLFLRIGRCLDLGSRWVGKYFEEMLLAGIGETGLERYGSVIKLRFVGIVVAWSGNELMDFGILEGSTELHFLNIEKNTSLPLPKLKPLCSSFLNYVPSS